MEFPWTANAGHGYLRARCSSIDLPSNGNFVRKIKRAGSPIFRKLISRLSNVKKSRQASNKTKSRASLRGCGRWNKTKMEENARKIQKSMNSCYSTRIFRTRMQGVRDSRCGQKMTFRMEVNSSDFPRIQRTRSAISTAAHKIIEICMRRTVKSGGLNSPRIKMKYYAQSYFRNTLFSLLFYARPTLLKRPSTRSNATEKFKSIMPMRICVDDK